MAPTPEPTTPPRRTACPRCGRSSCSGCRLSSTGAVATPGTQSSQFEVASEGEFTQAYHGFFLQDDWQVNNRLTLNAGLRLEVNGGMHEAQNRNLGPYDFISASPIEPAAKAAYAANPMPGLAPADFNVTGV